MDASSASNADPTQARDPGARLDIAEATSPDDAAVVVDLQRAVWGGGTVVPTGQLIAAASAGGTVLLAREAGRAVGFCYGFVGLDPEPTPHRHGDAARLRGGMPILWSHMLGVLPECRGRGIGRALKLAQAQQARARGLTRILWTFDPLEARNARLNLVSLGAVVARYSVDRYGPMEDALNSGLPSDRLVADWYVGDAPGRVAAPHGRVEPRSLLLVNPDPPHGPPIPEDEVHDHGGPLSIAVPLGDWRTEREEALAWRHNVRAAFSIAIRAGYVAVDLRFGDPHALYRLVRP